MGNFKRNTLALSVMTGVTALVGGVEPAAAAPETGSFVVDVTLQDDGTLNFPGEPFSGDFADLFVNVPDDDKSATQSFKLFDIQSGTRELTQVSVSVTLASSGESYVGADVSGSCTVSTDASGNTADCSASATNTSEFSVVIDLDGGINLTPSDTNPVTSPTATDECTAQSTNSFECSYGPTSDTWPAPPNFSITITDPMQLLLFSVDGSGMFDITASVDVSGQYGATIGATGDEPSAHNDWRVASYTTWRGDIEVTYTYRDVPNGVPEPATLFLLGSGLAGLGLLRRRTDNKA